MIDRSKYIELSPEGYEASSALSGDIIICKDEIVWRSTDVVYSDEKEAVHEFLQNGGCTILRPLPDWLVKIPLLVGEHGNLQSLPKTATRCRYVCRVRRTPGSETGWTSTEGVPCRVAEGDVLRPISEDTFAWYRTL